MLKSSSEVSTRNARKRRMPEEKFANTVKRTTAPMAVTMRSSTRVKPAASLRRIGRPVQFDAPVALGPTHEEIEITQLRFPRPCLDLERPAEDFLGSREGAAAGGVLRNVGIELGLSGLPELLFRPPLGRERVGMVREHVGQAQKTLLDQDRAGRQDGRRDHELY